MKRFFQLLIVFAAFTTLSAAEKEIVAYVNGDPVYKSASCTLEECFYSGIDRVLLLQEFEARQLTMADSLVDERVKLAIDNDYNGDEKAFYASLKSQNISIEQFWNQHRESMIIQVMRQLTDMLHKDDPSKPSYDKLLKSLRDRANIEYRSEDLRKMSDDG